MQQIDTGLMSRSDLILKRTENQKLSGVMLKMDGSLECYNGESRVVSFLESHFKSGDCCGFEMELRRILTLADDETNFYIERTSEKFEQVDITGFAFESSPKEEFLLLKCENSNSTAERCFYIRLNGCTLGYLWSLMMRAKRLFTGPQKVQDATFGEYYPDMIGDESGGNYYFGYARKGFSGKRRGRQVGIDQTVHLVPLLEYNRPLIDDAEMKEQVLIASRRSLVIEATEHGFCFRNEYDRSVRISFDLIERLWTDYKKESPFSQLIKTAADKKVSKVLSEYFWHSLTGKKLKIQKPRTRVFPLPEQSVMKVSFSPVLTKRTKNLKQLEVKARIFTGIKKRTDEVHCYTFRLSNTGAPLEFPEFFTENWHEL